RERSTDKGPIPRQLADALAATSTLFSALECDAYDVAMKYHFVANEPLNVEGRLLAVPLGHLSDEYQAIARVDGAAEADGIHAAEADIVGLHDAFGHDVVRAQLGRSLAHEDPGQ